MEYKMSNLLGAPYRGGSLLLHGQELLSPVGNRVAQARPRTRSLSLWRARRGLLAARAPPRRPLPRRPPAPSGRVASCLRSRRPPRAATPRRRRRPPPAARARRPPPAAPPP